jgi:hypothetical protein
MVLRRIDRNRPRAMAEAITLPSAILLAGAGASAAILGGLPLAAAAIVGAVAWAGRVLIAMPKKPRQGGIDPFALGEPWRLYVADALEAQRKFERAIERTAPGPMRDRLGELEQRVGDGVRECWEIAQRGDVLDDALRDLDVDGPRRELKAVEAELRASARPELEAAAAALRNQVASTTRLISLGRNTSDQLRRLNAQLDEAVARAVELSLRAVDVAEVEPLVDDVEAMVDELESLRLALEEVAPDAGGQPMPSTG